MSSSYYKWSLDKDVDLQLALQAVSGVGATGQSPEVAIRRHRDVDGNALDNYYWNGASFQATPIFLSMTEFDATNAAGLYTYFFEQTLIGVKQTYLVYFQNAGSPVGFAVEEHVFTDELFIPTVSGAVASVPGDTVMGRLAAMEDPAGDVAQANADAIWDEPLAGHLTAGTTGAALNGIASTYVGARQIDITVEDGSSLPIQGAQVDVFDVTNTVFLTRVFTDANGEVSVALDDDTYNVRLFASGYSFTVPEALVVSADAAVTFTGTSLVSVTPPSAPDLCVIFGTVRDAGGNILAGEHVEAFAVTPQVVSGVQKAKKIARTRTDQNGYFELELVRNIQVHIKIEEADVDSILTVPDQASQDLTSWT